MADDASRQDARDMFGFVIMSHRAPEQLLRLTRTLNLLYNGPPIACHHDFAQSPLDTSKFPSNVRFVEPSITTAWGKWSLVEASLAALRLLYSSAEPQFFFLISAADYPTVGADQVRSDLLRAQSDAFIDSFALDAALNSKGEDGIEIGDQHLAHHRAPHNLRLEQERYLRAQVKVPILRMRPPLHSTTKERYPRLGRLTFALPFDTPFSPFDANYSCYVGSQWFTANSKAAAHLLSPSAKDRHLMRYYRNRVIPDESYFQTVLRNAADLRVKNRTYRYAFWHGAHPIDLDEEHFQSVVDSGAHFARKFRPGDPVLDMIDRYLGVQSA
ncbi:MAG: beta-1,6-N-acetylglucosaminyltransferase [Sphingomicrobium sp.]|nr:beta-1,6-N-acetylglucosaminyltransferase [Sphingomonadales bacterium]